MLILSSPSLHPSLALSSKQITSVEKRMKRLRSIRPFDLPIADQSSVTISLSTVSFNSSFDALIEVWPSGAPPESAVSMIVDTGNSMLVMPHWEDFERLPTWKADYQVLASGKEPWGCRANIVRGPINMAATTQGTITIPDCVFYACTHDKPNPQSDEDKRTANFGAGCLNPWKASTSNTPKGIEVVMKAPLSYLTEYPYAEFDYESSTTILAASKYPHVSGLSSLRLYKAIPDGYALFDIYPDKEWMSLIPRKLDIGNQRTRWPGKTPKPIAMIDTGGGPVFLSDPLGYLFHTSWPMPVPTPKYWTAESKACQSTEERLDIVLGDSRRKFSYSIDPTHLSQGARGLSLVICEVNQYMQSQQGMNIGGISVLVNYVLVDYERARVGLKQKSSP